MEQHFRKVTFALISSFGFIPDEKEQNDMNEMARRRNGLFYGSTEIIENELKTLKFIIEDLETGKVYQVDPLLVTFDIIKP